MIHFVNQTKSDFTLKLTEGNSLCMHKKGDEKDSFNAIQVDVGNLRLDDEFLDAIQKKMDETDGVFEIRANRSSKFYISIPDISILYSEKYAENSMIHMFSKETGLPANEYYYPKSAIFVISDNSTSVDIKYAEKEINDLAYGDDYAKAPMYRVSCMENPDLGVKVTVFLCNVSKWAKIPEDTFIVISDNLKMRVGTITKTNKDGKEYTINALIRCDNDGNEIQSHRQDEAGRHPREGKPHNNGGGKQHDNRGNNNKKKGNKKYKGRAKMSSLTSKIPTIHND